MNDPGRKQTPQTLDYANTSKTIINALLLCLQFQCARGKQISCSVSIANSKLSQEFKKRFFIFVYVWPGGLFTFVLFKLFSAFEMGVLLGFCVIEGSLNQEPFTIFDFIWYFKQYILSLKQINS